MGQMTVNRPIKALVTNAHSADMSPTDEQAIRTKELVRKRNSAETGHEGQQTASTPSLTTSHRLETQRLRN
jgi:hypothetical protein